MKRLYLIVAVLLLACGGFAQQKGDSIPAKGYAVMEAGGKFQPYEFNRHPLGDDEILIDIEYSAICHSDIHRVRGDWGTSRFPIVAGHEMVGKVIKVGKDVTRFKVGDHAGVGALLNSCGECEYCKAGEETYCPKKVFCFAFVDPFHESEYTKGGFSSNIVVGEHYAVKIPENADMKRVAPLMCAGITVWSPLQFTHVKKGDRVAVAGFGGLGHLAVKYAVKLGAEVTVFDVSENKRQSALDMGASRYVNVNNPKEAEGLRDYFRVIINTIPAAYDPMFYLNMLHQDGDFVVLGIPPLDKTPTISMGVVARIGRKKIYGSQMGGMQEMQEMTDYSVRNNIYPDVEIISADQMDEAVQKVVDGEVRYRYVIDMKKQ